RVVLCVLVGCAFGTAGGIFQSVLGNPLASPDILGVSGGASLAAAVAILALRVPGAAGGPAAFRGAPPGAAVVDLAPRAGGVAGVRFVLIGVAAAFVVNGAIGYLLTRSEVDDVRSALVWMVGSIGTPRWADVAVLAVVVGVLAPFVGGVSRQLRALALGDE